MTFKKWTIVTTLLLLLMALSGCDLSAKKKAASTDQWNSYVKKVKSRLVLTIPSFPWDLRTEMAPTQDLTLI